jgi:hypothetical protein
MVWRLLIQNKFRRRPLVLPPAAGKVKPAPTVPGG